MNAAEAATHLCEAQHEASRAPGGRRRPVVVALLIAVLLIPKTGFASANSQPVSGVA
jgi:hypothetical protein